MTKITLLGAGSGFTQPLFTDILNIEGLDRGVIGLVDIDAKRLNISAKFMERLLDVMGKKNWKLEVSTDRSKVLRGTDFLISTIEVAGTKTVRLDNDIPEKYGITQAIGDTIGPGGIMKALRTLPAFLDILTDAQKICPQATILNYTNPMSIMTLTSNRVTSQPFIGLCHSVQATSRMIANILDIPYEEMHWRCGGVNHMSWFTELTWNGKDMYPKLKEAYYNEELYKREAVRLETLKHFGHFVTESSWHFSEYVPYYRKRPGQVEKLSEGCPIYKGGGYADRWPVNRKKHDAKRVRMAKGQEEIPTKRGHEFAADIIEAHLFNRRTVVYGSVPNTGLIPNLPQTGVVEVAIMVDKNGFTPTYLGPLPEQVAALCRSNMAVYELTSQGILNHDRESIVHAMMLDPLSAAICTPEEIRNMAEDLFRAEKKFIPDWCIARRSVARKKPKRPQKARKIVDGAEQVSSMAAQAVEEKAASSRKPTNRK
ncbi:alpha-glucosidase/alpha-galactosidase [bacterium]|nr:alpha-glucosidase/alpha-galactosidase [bacterium]